MFEILLNEVKMSEEEEEKNKINLYFEIYSIHYFLLLMVDKLQHISQN